VVFEDGVKCDNSITEIVDDLDEDEVVIMEEGLKQYGGGSRGAERSRSAKKK
jgi:hypothetical protein